MMMLTRNEIAEVIGISIDAVHKRIEAGTIPPHDFYDKVELLSESTIMELIEKIESNRIDYAIVKALAKTMTNPEIARQIGTTSGRVKWFCDHNDIVTKTRQRGRPKTSKKPRIRKEKIDDREDGKQSIFNNFFKQMKV